MTDQIDEETKAQRQAEIMEIQRTISRERLTSFVGKTLPVLVEGPSPESELVWQGRLAVQAPEVDGVVYLSDGDVKAGTIQMVKITEAHDYDLIGEVVSELN